MTNGEMRKYMQRHVHNKEDNAVVLARFVTHQDGRTLQQVCVRMSRDSPRMARIDHGPVTRLGWQGL